MTAMTVIPCCINPRYNKRNKRKGEMSRARNTYNEIDDALLADDIWRYDNG